MMYRDKLLFAHFSVKEYLLSPRISKGTSPEFQIFYSVAHQLISTICLVYLVSFDEPTLLQQDVLFEKFPLFNYAVLFWHKHYQVYSLDTSELRIKNLAFRLFDWRSKGFMNWIKIVLHPLRNDDVRSVYWF
jgi:hypothetical protein